MFCVAFVPCDAVVERMRVGRSGEKKKTLKEKGKKINTCRGCHAWKSFLFVSDARFSPM